MSAIASSIGFIKVRVRFDLAVFNQDFHVRVFESYRPTRTKTQISVEDIERFAYVASLCLFLSLSLLHYPLKSIETLPDYAVNILRFLLSFPVT